MNKVSPFHIIVIIASLALAGWLLKDSVRYYSKSEEQRQVFAAKHPNMRIFNLGLDLQGGMRLVLEVDRSNLKGKDRDDVLDRAYTIIENRINSLGVAEPTIQKWAPDRLIVELPGLKDEESAKEVVGKTAQLEFRLLRDLATREKAVEIVDNIIRGRAVSDTGQTAEADTLDEQSKQQQELAEQLFDGSDEQADEQADGLDTTQTLASEFEGDQMLEGVSSFRELLFDLDGQSIIGTLPKDKPIVEYILNLERVQTALRTQGLGSNDFLWGNDTMRVQNRSFIPLYYVKRSPEMRGDVVSDAQMTLDQTGRAEAKVDIEMNGRGARQFASVTGRNVNKFLAIVLDNTVYSAPKIIQKIPLGRAEITGNFSRQEAQNLAIVLRAGALPAPVKIIEERTVGPSLGQDSITRGLIACAIGLGLVLIFMVIYYGASGLIANIAVVLNLVFVMAIMAQLQATLSLPGIAGLILLIGMAVDANVIIFERIREELATGKSIRSAVDTGFGRAWITILDANITTLFTAFILMWIGTGPIKGFAITLILGISMSLYTAIFITRVLINLMTASPSLKKLSI